MRPRALVQAAAGLMFCVCGYFVANRDRPSVHTVLATAGACNMATDIYEPRSGSATGSVVLLHGLAANKKVMSFTAQEFANQDLRVFVPDLPGHGRTPGPFSPARTEACTAALLRDLARRKAVVVERTLLAGHSMGGAIALRVAPDFPLAGVIAISPAPMHSVHGVPPEVLLFSESPHLGPHSLVLSAAWEPAAIKKIAADLVTQSSDSSNQYTVVPNTTHVSILFSSATFDAIRSWSSQLLATSATAPFPTSMPALGCVLGILGLSLIAPPFLREMTMSKNPELLVDSQPAKSIRQTVLLITILASFAIALLRFLVPLRFIHLFQGDYFASFLLLVGVATLVIFRESIPPLRTFLKSPWAASSAAGLLLVLLYAAWFELTFYEAWLTSAGWLRFPLLVLIFLPWHLGEEILLGSPQGSPRVSRLLRFLLIRALLALALLAGIRYLHSGQILFLLLVVYFVLFSILQRLASDVIRAQTRSLAATAIFGAILLAGFALAIFPIA
jgi:pimeloyl-ACP methyl ester carboxylesterase